MIPEYDTAQYIIMAVVLPGNCVLFVHNSRKPCTLKIYRNYPKLVVLIRENACVTGFLHKVYKGEFIYHISDIYKLYY